MVERDIDGGEFGEDAFHLFGKGGPFAFAPEIVDHQKAAAEEIGSQGFGFVVGEPEVAAFGHVDEGKSFERVVAEFDDFFFFDGKAGGFVEAAGEIDFGVWEIDVP